MAEYEIKLGTTLKFNTGKEQDIIDKIENLADRRKISDFLTSLIRVAFDNPEVLKLVESNMNEIGVTGDRKEFFNTIESEVAEMKHKVDNIFDRAVKVYMLAQFGKKIGIDKRASNLVQAQFILQQQIEELCNTLGVSNLNNIYASNRTDAILTRADEVLEYIIDTYDNIVTELRANVIDDTHIIYNAKEISPNNSDSSKNKIVDNQAKDSVNVVETGNITKNIQMDNGNRQVYNIDNDQNKSSEVLLNNEEVKDDDEIIDFGENADLGALSKFIGG